ncbi:electron transfer flavo protein alpha subunit [Dichomitus squalens]|uniref:Probable electron transfer flavoprotein subunit alpha n=1 Tax=Dichomitus squalens TaxID=114155 RepID=A0A4Q9PYF4_9APHY|nr:electron transfer flavo protein alpha subunit [Dichomitus squalens LYAD-421 SS1]EJF65239.1 electron transfer flavo protein alpha subunit [Dichomitus squalens LYAD-421 SS1]TBU48617.1 electron transfer flavo protein alpha subunit [Dichomitus squalens]TBU59675.1 electron transfer flavo protein alpha subunit [Dichomitus squalens]
MLRVRPALHCRSLLRRYATVSGPHALVFLEHREGVIDSGSLSALTAAQQLGGQVTGIVIGAPDQVKGVVEKAKTLKGLNTVIHSASEQYAHSLPEAVSPLFEKLLGESSPYTHVVSAHSSSAKSILPRVAARLDLPAVSDITSLEHDASSNATTFTRPIYAGNAIATVKAPSSLRLKFFTVRSTAFKAAAADESVQAEEQTVDPVEVPNLPTQHVRTDLTKSDRPELGSASRVVSGGRALKNAETFNSTLEPLADVLGAAIGASRAAVDAGYADNSLQVGQTGKVVAPELYIAIGISGAIQHLAGMKDSKLIVAINKDPEAPIFQVADIGLVADLYQAVPELVEKLKQ